MPKGQLEAIYKMLKTTLALEKKMLKTTLLKSNT
jgi:hypothetical protein